MPTPSEQPGPSALTNQHGPGVHGLRVSVLALLAFVLGVAVYAPAFEGPFVWDDEALLMRAEVRELQPLPFYFSRPFWLASDTSGAATYYRPIAILSLALDHAVHGENPAGFHLTNLLLHGLSSVLVFLLGRRVGASLAAALVGALLFAWFPRLSEAVGWISGRTDLLATCFSLSALLVALGASRGRTWTCGVLILLGLLSKEVALGAALAVAAYEWRSGQGKSLRQRLLRLLPLSSVGVVYASLRLSVLGPALHEADMTPSQRLAGSLEALGRYAAMIVDGWQPRLNIGHLGSLAWPYAVLGGAAVLGTLLALFRLRPEAKEGLLLGTGLTSLALVLHLLPYQSTVSAADRFLYLPLAACAPVLAYALSRARRPVALGLAAALALSYAPFTWQRAQVWGDDILFWGTAVQEQDPRHNALSHAGLASILANGGLFSEAMIVYERIQPGDRGAYLEAVQRQARLLATNGETDRILEVLTRAERVLPSPRLYEALALAYAGAGKPDQARQAALEFERRITDKQLVDALWAQVAMADSASRAASAGAAGAVSPTGPESFAERIAWARHLAKIGRFRVAMSEFMLLLDEPSMTSQELRAILVFSLGYGTPEQVNRVHEHLLALDPATPGEFSLLVAERNQRVLRLRNLCRELGIR